jgi:hypothetical protein
MEKLSNLLYAAKELAEMVDDVEEYLNELSDVIAFTKESSNTSRLETFIDKWECRTISSNDISLGGILYSDD